MKILAITSVLLMSLNLFAETATDEKPNYKKNEDQGKVVSTAKKVSGETKRALRIVGRKSMDATCELGSSKAECEKQKAEHASENKKDEVMGVDGN